MPPRGTLPLPNDGWAIFAEPPGRRDLVEDRYWAASLERSTRRRNVRREPRIVTRGRAKVSLALTAAAIGGPASAGVASAQASTTLPGTTGANLGVGSN